MKVKISINFVDKVLKEFKSEAKFVPSARYKDRNDKKFKQSQNFVSDYDWIPNQVLRSNYLKRFNF